MLLDALMTKRVDENINMSVPWYLGASYAYYIDDDPILSDEAFDNLAKIMLQKWDQVHHYHKHLITIDDLEATTYLGEYPKIVESSVTDLRRRKEKGEI